MHRSIFLRASQKGYNLTTTNISMKHTMQHLLHICAYENKNMQEMKNGEIVNHILYGKAKNGCRILSCFRC